MTHHCRIGLQNEACLPMLNQALVCSSHLAYLSPYGMKQWWVTLLISNIIQSKLCQHISPFFIITSSQPDSQCFTAINPPPSQSSICHQTLSIFSWCWNSHWIQIIIMHMLCYKVSCFVFIYSLNNTQLYSDLLLIDPCDYLICQVMLVLVVWQNWLEGDQVAYSVDSRGRCSLRDRVELY